LWNVQIHKTLNWKDSKLSYFYLILIRKIGREISKKHPKKQKPLTKIDLEKRQLVEVYKK